MKGWVGAVDVLTELTRLGVPPTAASDAVELMPDGVLGVLLYGSHARGDHGPDSDVDLLVLAEYPAGTRLGRVASVSVYTPVQLATASGTLFGMHLARDGVVIQDSDGLLHDLLVEMGEPDVPTLFERIRHLGAVLEDEVGAHLVGRVRVARYLLRTAVYLEALAEGEACFSVRELARRAADADLVSVLSSNPQVAPAPTAATFEDLNDRLIEVLGALSHNPHGSLVNLVVAEWWEDRDRATLAALALADENSEFDYAALSKVLL